MPFAAVTGQDKAVRSLQESMRQDKVAGAYLFAGPDGVGKFLTALEFAKALNCTSGAADACGGCASCVKVDKAQHPDVLVIDNADAEVKIEDVRQLQRNLALRPYEGAKKVGIIRHAHLINSASGSALLKTLEEPPRDSVLILVTEKPQRLLRTIVSRCRTVRFRAFSRQSLEELLCRQYGVSAELSRFLAFVCEGKLGSALALKDSDVVRQRDALVAEFGVPSRVQGGQRYALDRQDVRRTLNMLALWFRDVYCAKLGMPAGLIVNADRGPELQQAAQELSFERLAGIMQWIADALRYSEHNVNARLILANFAWYLKG